MRNETVEMLQRFEFESYLNVMFSSYLIKNLIHKSPPQAPLGSEFYGGWGRSLQERSWIRSKYPPCFSPNRETRGVSVVIPTDLVLEMDWFDPK